ncbi:cytochrome C oxidase subunit IV family protein [Lutibacter sp.]|uniref:cytochrome C oxidase subunit IV family protein n=1 Tax=Lutibacter sp. TaxID=1925666 RepID=UPI00356894FA
MNSRIIFVWVLLVLLTITVGVISSFSLSYAAIAILGLSALKFIGVSFYFMELKKAHIFWKAAILIYVFLFSIITLIYLN